MWLKKGLYSSTAGVPLFEKPRSLGFLTSLPSPSLAALRFRVCAAPHPPCQAARPTGGPARRPGPFGRTLWHPVVFLLFSYCARWHPQTPHAGPSRSFWSLLPGLRLYASHDVHENSSGYIRITCNRITLYYVTSCQYHVILASHLVASYCVPEFKFSPGSPRFDRTKRGGTAATP